MHVYNVNSMAGSVTDFLFSVQHHNYKAFCMDISIIIQWDSPICMGHVNISKCPCVFDAVETYNQQYVYNSPSYMVIKSASC